MSSSVRGMAAGGLVLAVNQMLQAGAIKVDNCAAYSFGPLSYIGGSVMLALIFVGAWSFTSWLGRDA